jgi:endonuclease YncB( thermonuclease family)
MSSDRLYWYRLKVTRIIDGDTFEVVIDKGHRDYAERRVRLYGVDAYEKNTELGWRAYEIACDFLVLNTWYFAKSHQDKIDSFGRYLYEIFLDDGCTVSLGQMLIDNNVAVPRTR